MHQILDIFYFILTRRLTTLKSSEVIWNGGDSNLDSLDEDFNVNKICGDFPAVENEVATILVNNFGDVSINQTNESEIMHSISPLWIGNNLWNKFKFCVLYKVF